MKVKKFHEELQVFHWTFNLLFLLPLLLVIWIFFGVVTQESKPEPEEIIGLFIIALILAFIPLLFGRMRIVVDGVALKVEFGYLGWIKKRIPLARIKEAEVVEFRPLRQFGGWGLRCGHFRGEKTGCISLKGNRGVLLTLLKPTRTCIAKTNKLIIASQNPERFWKALIGLLET